MCSGLCTQAIETAVGELVKQRKCFTGEDVFKRIHNKQIHRDTDFSGVLETAPEISHEVRKLFNTQSNVFYGYGSTIVPNHGPVMYFALPFHAKIAVQKIANAVTVKNAPALDPLFQAAQP